MSTFGWSLPAGCGRLPGEEDEPPCDVCGQFVDDCICPPCPVCGEQGNPDCYVGNRRGKKDHGLLRTPTQIAALEAAEARWEADNAEYDRAEESAAEEEQP